MYDEIYIPLNKLSSRLGLPETYLKDLADRKVIPSLNVRGRLRFNPLQVQDALDGIASKKQGVTHE